MKSNFLWLVSDWRSGNSFTKLIEVAMNALQVAFLGSDHRFMVEPRKATALRVFVGRPRKDTPLNRLGINPKGEGCHGRQRWEHQRLNHASWRNLKVLEL